MPALADATPRSAHLEGQGVTVFRRDGGEVYVALDWGQTGGGHGHPDRLNVLFAEGATRWLDDLGTSSYVDPSLHWYRSTLAHNAPLCDGHSQRFVPGRLLAHDERGGVGWVFAHVDDIAPGVSVQRAVIVTPDYFVDELTWSADRHVRFELPVHFGGEVHEARFTPGVLDGGGGLEDGFEFVRDVRAARVAAMTPVRLSSRGTGREARGGSARRRTLTGSTRGGAGPAAGHDAPVLRGSRCRAQAGVVRSVWAWSERVDAVDVLRRRVAIDLGDERHEHHRTDEYWQMELTGRRAERH